MQDDDRSVDLDPYAPTASDAATERERDRDSAEVDRAEVDSGITQLRSLSFEERYELDHALGEGGMGAVMLFRDRQIGRRVALKVMHDTDAASPRARRRFVTEARVQGQLEHPAVVPVYDLGIDPEGRIYFTMKRVRGVTLADIARELRHDPESAEKRWSRRRLLTAFSQVCLAVDFAHQRGVFHRDLKPGNIMFGDFGEVYVLDWGVAKVRGHADAPDADSVSLDDLDTDETATVPGSLLGTPGYMAPEQLRGLHDSLGPASDVYALGAVLFELLALSPLHERTSFADVVSSTLRGPDARPSVRAQSIEVSPEIDDIVVRATALDPSARFPSARDMHEAIERYLDGERDEQRRRELSNDHASAAARFADRATESQGPSAIEERRQAMREVGRALALDPENELAFSTMMSLLSRPPDHTPPEIDQQLEESQYTQTKWLGKIGAVAYAAVLPLYLPFFLWVGVRSWSAVIAFYAPLLAAAATSGVAALKERPPIVLVLMVMIFSNLAFSALSLSFGPWLITPTLVAINTAAFALHLAGWQRMVAIVFGCLSVLWPVALHLAGALPTSHLFANGDMVITPGGVAFPPLPMTVFLTAIALGAVLTGGLVVTRVRDVLNTTERQLYLYAWHMREIVRSPK
jgi:serine/threonine-protein kinase